MQQSWEAFAGGSTVNISPGAINVENNTAQVTMVLKPSGGSTKDVTLTLQKIGNDWKVDAFNLTPQ